MGWHLGSGGHENTVKTRKNGESNFHLKEWSRQGPTKQSRAFPAEGSHRGSLPGTGHIRGDVQRRSQPGPCHWHVIYTLGGVGGGGWWWWWWDPVAIITHAHQSAQRRCFRGLLRWQGLADGTRHSFFSTRLQTRRADPIATVPPPPPPIAMFSFPFHHVLAVNSLRVGARVC